MMIQKGKKWLCQIATDSNFESSQNAKRCRELTFCQVLLGQYCKSERCRAQTNQFEAAVDAVQVDYSDIAYISLIDHSTV